jgi:WD40 repeat protein
VIPNITRSLSLITAVCLAGSAWSNVSTGDLLVAGRIDNNVTQFNGTTGAFVSTFAHTGGIGNPVGIAYGADGNLYVANVATNNVLRFNGLTGAFIDTFATGGGLNSPRGIAFGPDGNLYVASAINAEILKYNGTTGAFIGIAASGNGLNGPVGITFGKDGSMYVSSALSNQVLKWSSAGTFSGVFASGGGLNNPTYSAFGPDGNFYVVSANTNNVLRYNGTTGAFVDIFSSGNGLDLPIPIAFGPDNNLYVGNAHANNVLKFSGSTGAFIGVFAANGGLQNPNGMAFVPPPPGVSTLSLSISAIVGGNGLTGTVTFTKPVYAVGGQLTFASDNAAVILPAAVTLAPKATTSTFALQTKGVSIATTVHITATLNGISKVAILIVNPATLSSFGFYPSAVVGAGNGSYGMAVFNGKTCSAATTFTATSSNVVATIPATVTAVAQSNVTYFSIKTTSIAADTSAVIQVHSGGITKSATLTIKAIPTVTASMTWVQVGTTYTYTLTIHNTGKTAVGSFVFAKQGVVAKSFLTVAPAALVSPIGWSAGAITHAGVGDGYGILWTAITPLAPGASVVGFKFASTLTPTHMKAASSLFPTFPMTTSFAYVHGAYTDPGFGFVVVTTP